MSDIYRIYRTNQLYYNLFNNCISYWDLRGDASDIMGINHGTVSGATLVTDHLGNLNSAYHFDGSNDIITVSDNSSLDLTNEISIEAMIRPTGFNANSTICTKNVSYYFQVHSDGKLACYTYHPGGSSSYSYSNTVLSLDTDYHVVFTEKNGERKLYIDKVLDNTISMESGIDPSADPLTIGAQDGSRYFDGIIYFVRLCDAEILQDKINLLADLSNKMYIYPLKRGY